MAIPEWEVELPGGDRPSQTDILAICRNGSGLVVLGVEAKANEPFGPTLGEKRSEASGGQLERIAYLEDLLGKIEPFAENIRYQLLHRTASALLTAREFHAAVAAMIVQSFSLEGRWREDFDNFVEAVGAVKLVEELYEINQESGPRMLLGWCKGGAEYLEAEIQSAF